MTSFLLLAAADGGSNPFKEIAETFGWNPVLFFSQVVSFLVVAFLLNKFAYGPIQKVLQDRSRRIEEGLRNADLIKKELASAEEQKRRLLTDAGAQANKIIEEARKVGAGEIEKASQQAIATATDIIAKARQSSEAELVRMKLDLRKEFGRLVVAASQKATGKMLTLEDQQRLAEETNRQLAA